MAAVLVLLFENADGQLEVLLTTRSAALRTHAGQTACPGGKADPDETSPITTALREAHEEVGLQSSSVHLLCTLPPFPSLHRLLVVPVLALLTDLSVLSTLQPSASEVAAIWHYRLDAVLDPSVSLSLGEGKLVDKGSADWPYEDEVYNTSDTEWLYGMQYRMHRIRTTHSPIKGLTADILLLTAQIAYDREPSYPRNAPRQVPFEDMIAVILKEYREQQQ
ncbi:hypothetical protein EXIGLDRAFT_713756 [Exidia glandulosa HHB12029]|uniref:Nudix hydrolase domain-containing protein n=1 Tax=Exidia glandulosa HHB12029 TaxID=1314781 RepID=A0A165PWR3_EXIGL|nr:hypothetical protein EXIGLDRAFT_713756 [Exidia glandulosa HHB12029]